MKEENVRPITKARDLENVACPVELLREQQHSNGVVW